MLRKSQNNDGGEDICVNDSNGTQRRTFIQQMVHSLAISSALVTASGSAEAADNEGLPTVTHKVFMDLRISRSDGSFYVKDAPTVDQSGALDEPFYGQLVLGLFGNQTPNHVEQFLKYVEVPFEVDNPLPSYSRGRFTTLDVNSGLLLGGVIPGLEVTTLAGGNVLEYGSRVIPAKLWIESTKPQGAAPTAILSHNRKGLLTHRNLDVTPSFGITTRKSSTFLDATNTVFGCVLEDNNGFLDQVLDIPVLTDRGMVSRTEMSMSNEVAGANGGGSLASSVFTAQREIFRGAAKSFGDSRLEKVYDGKLLRRIEVTKVGLL